MWPAAPRPPEKLLTLGAAALLDAVEAEDSRTEGEESPFAVTVLVRTPETLSLPGWEAAAWLCEEAERVGACRTGVATREEDSLLPVEDEELLRVAVLDRVTGVDVLLTVEEELLRVAELLRVWLEGVEAFVEVDDELLRVAELLRVWLEGVEALVEVDDELLRVAELLRVWLEGVEALVEVDDELLRVAEEDLVAELLLEDEELEDERLTEDDEELPEEELRVVPEVVLLEDPPEVRVCASMMAGVRNTAVASTDASNVLPIVFISLSFIKFILL